MEWIVEDTGARHTKQGKEGIGGVEKGEGAPEWERPWLYWKAGAYLPFLDLLL
jgi:hypothetical protein